jgi:hypothetical protein
MITEEQIKEIKELCKGDIMSVEKLITDRQIKNIAKIVNTLDITDLDMEKLMFEYATRIRNVILAESVRYTSPPMSYRFNKYKNIWYSIDRGLACIDEYDYEDLPSDNWDIECRLGRVEDKVRARHGIK